MGPSPGQLFVEVLRDMQRHLTAAQRGGKNQTDPV
jgi:hypothetical protein